MRLGLCLHLAIMSPKDSCGYLRVLISLPEARVQAQTGLVGLVDTAINSVPAFLALAFGREGSVSELIHRWASLVSWS